MLIVRDVSRLSPRRPRPSSVAFILPEAAAEVQIRPTRRFRVGVGRRKPLVPRLQKKKRRAIPAFVRHFPVYDLHSDSFIMPGTSIYFPLSSIDKYT